MMKGRSLLISFAATLSLSSIGSAELIGHDRELAIAMDQFQEEVKEAKEMQGIGEEGEETKGLPNPSDPPILANPHKYKFLHRPILANAKVTPLDVRSNTVLIEGVSTGVRVKVPPLSSANADRYGKWMFYDGYQKEFDQERPVVDFSKYEAGDAPPEDFPEDAWQSDAVYIMHFLDNAQKLIDRAREAIYEEYGFPVNGPSVERDAALGFRKFNKMSDMKGYPIMATEKNFDGLVRRLLHAMMTNQEFKVALNGHSVAAGHDSNFWQSYIHQFHHVMEPIFTRLGMKLSTYNYGRGGLGTFQDTMAGTCTLGDPDVLIWDSGMTELNKGIIDAFYRQAIIAGTRVPFFINDREEYPGEFARFNSKESKTIMMTPLDEQKRNDVPYAIRYMNCESSEMSCNKPIRRYNKGCWDHNITDFVPPTTQKEPPFGGQHPSWRSYQLTSRKLALIFLHALEEAIDLWQENTVIIGQFPLDGQFWHLTDHFAKIRKETQESLADSLCMEKVSEPFRKVCSVPMRGRTEFTGRANPNRTSLRSIIRPTPDGYLPTNDKEVVYDKPITVAWQTIPEGEVDVRAIVGAGGFDDDAHRKLTSNVPDASKTNDVSEPEAFPDILREHTSLRKTTEKIIPGKGWHLQASVPAGYCDGSTDYHSCNRDTSNDCLANDHQDSRTGVFGDALSGWIVFDIDYVVEGFVVVKLESWHKGEKNLRTIDWETVNNERMLHQYWPDDLEIDVSVDGVITTYNMEMLEEKIIKAERVVELFVLHDKKPKKPKDMEIAIRLRCTAESTKKHLCNINISHLYWA